MKKVKRLTLVDVKEIEFKGDDGLITKFKYTFFEKDEVKPVVGYLNDLHWEEKVVDTGEYSEDDSFLVALTGKEFQGEITWRLQDPNTPDLE